MQIHTTYIFIMWIVTDDDYMLEGMSKLHLSNNASRNGSNMSDLNYALY